MVRKNFTLEQIINKMSEAEVRIARWATGHMLLRLLYWKL
jgi:hypothetical protein